MQSLTDNLRLTFCLCGSVSRWCSCSQKKECKRNIDKPDSKSLSPYSKSEWYWLVQLVTLSHESSSVHRRSLKSIQIPNSWTCPCRRRVWLAFKNQEIFSELDLKILHFLYFTKQHKAESNINIHPPQPHLQTIKSAFKYCCWNIIGVFARRSHLKGIFSH